MTGLAACHSRPLTAPTEVPGALNWRPPVGVVIGREKSTPVAALYSYLLSAFGNPTGCNFASFAATTNATVNSPAINPPTPVQPP